MTTAQPEIAPSGPAPGDPTSSGTDAVPVTVTRSGTGPPVMVVHGGGGPASVAPIVDHLAAAHDVSAPTIPGWDGTERPDWLTSIDDVALTLLDYLAAQELEQVTLVGSSIGGWVASAMAVFDSDRGRVQRLCLVDAVGIEVPGQPIRDFFALDARGVAEYSFHDSDRFYVDPASMTREQLDARRQNMATMRTYAGDPYMHDPHLVHRLGRVRIPAIGVWGAADRIVTPAYGRAYLDALGASTLNVIAGAGHLPHIEKPDETFAVLDAFVDGRAEAAR